MSLPKSERDFDAEIDELNRKRELLEKAEPPPVEVVEEPASSWTHGTVELSDGSTWEVKTPNPQAITVVGMSSGAGDQMQARILWSFLERHMSPQSFEEYIERSISSDLEAKVANELLEKMVQLGTDRPTKPSANSRG